MNFHDKIFVAGHRGLVGSAVLAELQARGFTNLLTVNRTEVDLTDPVAVKWWFSCYEPEYIFLCAAKVGGIKANASDPLKFFYDNLDIQRNVMLNAAHYGAEKLVFLGSSCIYPRDCPQPIREEYLLTGPIEKTTEAYALAKIAGIRTCQWMRQLWGANFVSAMPCNLYGEADNFSEEAAHIIPGMLARMHRAKITGAPVFDVWGDGSAKREFLYAGDLAKALLTVMEKYDEPEPINTGSGFELTVRELAWTIADVVGYSGKLRFDATQPTGTPRKILDNSKITKLGWKPEMDFRRGLALTYEAFCKGARRV